jgi:type II secretory pathway component PulC
MTPLSAVLALLLTGLAASPPRACIPRGPSTRVRVSFLADSDLASLAKWAKETTCSDYSFERSLSARRLAQGVILTVTGRDVRSVFEILLHTMNLRSTGKGAKRTIVATGPETEQSKAANEREKAEVGREKVLANLDGEIKRIDPNHYAITRRGADAILAEVPSIARSLRVVPEAKGGKPIGFRLLSIKRSSLLTHFGFQNGDLIVALNGNDLVSADKALEAYAKFRTAGVVQVSFRRSGKRHNLELKVE